jgi:hypothetical protein
MPLPFSLSRRSVGRNDPCPCASGKKFKRCCDLSLRARADRAATDPVHLAQFGHVKPLIHANFRGQKLVAVGNTVFFSEKWRTFPDFLVGYARHALGSGWGQNEIAKPAAERHPIVRWYQHFCEIQKGALRNASGIYEIKADGVSSAFMVLAYDLYVLRHHDKLQEQVLRRLRRHDQFFGARYELFVAATFIRAGFDIEYEDEDDPSKKHPEFIGTHRATNFRIAVEAKAKHRTDVKLGDETPKASVKRLLVNAARKRAVDPYAVFVEVNLPPDPGTSPPSWMPEVYQTVDEVAAAEGGHPFDLVFFTNVPHQYGGSGEADPPKHFYARKPTQRIPVEIDQALVQAISQYGRIPDSFPP